MKSKRFYLLLVVILAALLLSACSSQALLTNSWPGLASDGETAYLTSGQYVYAVRMIDGQEIWRYPGQSNKGLNFIMQPVIASDGTIIIGSAGSDHRLVAIDPERINVETNSPEETWIFSGAQDRWIAPPLVLDGKVYAPNTDGTLYILDLDDGLTTKAPVREIELGGAVWSQPVSDGNLVYITTLGHNLFAIDLATYEYAWPPIDLGGAAPGSPLVNSAGDVYVGSFASELVKVNPATGTKTLLVSTQGWVWDEPVTDGKLIYFGDLDGYFYAVDIAGGQQVWTIQPDGPVVGSPLIVADGVIFVTESGSVYMVDPDGKIVWQREVGGQIYTAPVAGKEQIVIAPMKADFSLIVLDTSGNRIWTFAPEK